jgi:CubicO group peptidase (beta-lactamase class C family)
MMNAIGVQHENSDPDFQQLCEVVVAAMKRLQVPGVAVGILHDGREFMAGFGVTNVEHPLPVTADTLFQIGSTTKTFTGTAIMRLVEMGKLNLDTPVHNYLPELRLGDQTAEERVTTRHLLTHMGGWVGDYFDDTGEGDDALARYVAKMAALPQVTPLDTLWAYNNTGFSLAGRVIEAVTDQSYEAALQALLLEPLGLAHSFFFAKDVMTHRFAVGHRVTADGPVVEREWALARSAHPAGGITSSVRDQLRYGRFQLGDGSSPEGQQLLTAETMRRMQSPQVKANLDRQMGLSWILREIGDVPVVQHGGATNGQLSAFVLVPARQFAITVLTNADRGSVLNDEVVRWALKHYLGLVEPEPSYLTLAADELEAYSGAYDAHMSRLELYVEDSQLMVQAIPKGGFPYQDSPPGPTPPPSRLAFYAPNCVIALDEPLENVRAEFLRGEDGRIVWLRTTRLHKRLP